MQDMKISNQLVTILNYNNYFKRDSRFKRAGIAAPESSALLSLFQQGPVPFFSNLIPGHAKIFFVSVD